jgi:hypothetical protein
MLAARRRATCTHIELKFRRKGYRAALRLPLLDMGWLERRYMLDVAGE